MRSPLRNKTPGLIKGVASSGEYEMKYIYVGFLSNIVASQDRGMASGEGGQMWGDTYIHTHTGEWPLSGQGSAVIDQ